MGKGFWPFNGVKMKRLLDAVKSIGLKNSMTFAAQLPAEDVDKWIQKRGVKDLNLLMEYFGTGNIVKFVGLLGIDKCIRLAGVLSPEEMILLSREARNLSMPRLSRNQKKQIEEWKKLLKKKRKERRTAKKAAEADKAHAQKARKLQKTRKGTHTKKNGKADNKRRPGSMKKRSK